jgi:hypothetical protein
MSKYYFVYRNVHGSSSDKHPPRPQSSSVLKDLDAKPVAINRPRSLSHNLGSVEMKSKVKLANGNF